MVDWLFEEHATTVLAQTLKGTLFVIVTAILVYGLSRRAIEVGQRESAMEEFDEVQHLLDAVLGNLGEAILVVDPENRSITKCNSAATKIFGYSESELLGMSTEILHKDHDSYVRFGAIGEPVLGRDGVFRTQYQLKRKDGFTIDVEISVVALHHELGWQTGVVSIVRDISERVRAYKALEESERAYRLLADNTLDVIWSMRSDYTFEYVNPAVESVTGFTASEVIGTNLRDHIDDAHLPKLVAAIEAEVQKGPEGTGDIIETELIHKNGSPVPVEIHGKVLFDEQGEVIGLQGTTREISERLMLEAQLRQSEKLESIGTLAAGIAHEINNPLSAITGYAALIARGTQEERKLHEYATKIDNESRRIDTIIKNLLGFARLDNEKEFTPIDIAATIEAVLSLISASLRHDMITLEVQLPAELPNPIANSQQIQQVLLNLLTNARDALNAKYPERDPNKNILIRASALSDSDGGWVRTTIEDLGTGISENAQERIFDPFFTTKAPGKGTGLGLWIIYRIVKQHSGRITVDSEPGKFTRFNVDLPLKKYSEAT